MERQASQAQYPPEGATGLAANDVAPLRLNSKALMGKARELIIQHEGREYRLRLTRNGKLILTA